MRKMPMTERKIVRLMLPAVLALILGMSGCTGSKRPQIVVFSRDGCPDCIQMQEVLDELLVEYPHLTVAYYKLDEPGAADRLRRLVLRYRVKLPAGYRTPIIFVGEEAFTGATRATEMRLRTAIVDCALHGCPSPLR